MKRKINSTLFTTRGAMIAAVYVALTLLASAMGLSSGVIQFRFSEALCILPIFLPEAIPGLFIGCLISNLIAGGVIWDIIFGTMATLIGALGAYLLRRLPERYAFVATIPTILSNAIIVPFILQMAYGVQDGYWFLFMTVGIGEVLSAGVLGTFLYKNLKKVFS